MTHRINELPAEIRNSPSEWKSPDAYAHTLPDRTPEEWQNLLDHLEGVSRKASTFSSTFNSADWGRLTGLWHDLGKYSDAFQSYLRAASSPDPHEAETALRIDHSTAGAQHAVSEFGILGHLLAFPIAGHHSGLLDAIGDGACLEARLRKEIEPCPAAPPSLLKQLRPEPPLFIRDALGTRDGFSVAFFVRMVFSCLVDADFLDTEAFIDASRAGERPGWPDDVLRLMSRALDNYIVGLQPQPTEVNRQRSLVLKACLKAADRAPGIFSLTVPTGGGKTLSSLAFALKHAVRHGLRRVVYVVPFTSIIEQNAEVYRDVMAPLMASGIPDPVIEHHSQLDAEIETTSSRLAAENWDAPLVVTTAVQFYESLFANRTSRCRKLHNLAQAVVILDEAQTLPVDFLQPCLRALDELRRNYGTTVVLCTATQPAVHHREDFRIGLELEFDHEIVPDPKVLYAALKRVRVEREDLLADEELAVRLMQEKQVLCIVNTRGHARRLAELLGESESHFHLSALMCPEHRSDRIRVIGDRMKTASECRVISTRLIEAGVDIDFPVVYRAMAGLDSIAQAAGRCNRNGRLPVGRTVVFEPENLTGERFIADTAGSARQVLPLYEDPLSLEAVEHYFRLYYWDQSARWDAKGILGEFVLDQNPRLPFLLGFARSADRFRLIEDLGKSVIIPWGKNGERLCEELRCSWNGPSVALRRKLQRYTVQVPLWVWRDHRARAFEVVHDHYQVLLFPEIHYSERTGLRLETDASELFIT